MITVKQIKVVEVVTMRGYKKTGFFAGLLGDITNCDIKGFEHLYRITFRNGASVLASWDDIDTIVDDFIELTNNEWLN